jgi:hypothetical protein
MQAKTLSIIIITVIVMILLYFLIPRIFPSPCLDSSSLKENLRKENDSLKVLLFKLEEKAEAASKQAEYYKAKADSSKVITKTIIKYANDKIRSVNSFSNSDKVKFWSEFNPDTNIIR